MKFYKRSDAFEVVKAGYDQLGNRYTSEREKADNWKEINSFTSMLLDKGSVLDAGSGTGVPIALHLTKAGFKVTGIDISDTMLDVARQNVPHAKFIKMNMTEIDFPDESFDGIISTYAIIHVPREFHQELFKAFYSILKPNGAMLLSVACGAWEEFDQFMGVDMFWSHFDRNKSHQLIREAGFDIVFGRDVETGSEKHHWVLATKK